MPEYGPDLISRVVALVKRGNFPETSARACGIPHTTWVRWLRKGRDGDPKYAPLVDAVNAAEAEAEAAAVATIQLDESWQSKAWFLERKFPERWAKREPRPIQEQDDVGEVQKLESVLAALKSGKAANDD